MSLSISDISNRCLFDCGWVERQLIIEDTIGVGLYIILPSNTYELKTQSEKSYTSTYKRKTTKHYT